MLEPVMLPGGHDVQVVGESHYQPNLDKVCGGRTSGGHQRSCTAILVAERNNPYDSNAVAVYIDNLQVGHLSRDAAKAFRPVMDRAGAHLVACDAQVVGGWDRGDGDTGNYGVRLDLADIHTCLQVVALPPVARPKRGLLARIFGTSALLLAVAACASGSTETASSTVVDEAWQADEAAWLACDDLARYANDGQPIADRQQRMDDLNSWAHKSTNPDIVAQGQAVALAASDPVLFPPALDLMANTCLNLGYAETQR